MECHRRRPQLALYLKQQQQQQQQNHAQAGMLRVSFARLDGGSKWLVRFRKEQEDKLHRAEKYLVRAFAPRPCSSKANPSLLTSKIRTPMPKHASAPTTRTLKDWPRNNL